MSLSVKDVAGALKLEIRVVERLASYLYPNKVLLTHDEALVLRDYYYKFGGGPAGMEVGPYNEWMKLERMKALVRARLEMIEEKQNSCVTKLNSLAGVYTPVEETMPVPISSHRAHQQQEATLKFPSAKNASKSAAALRERRINLFGRV
ncbi:MAG: hypothetical protein FWE09_05975 [Treponema sp.]|nr:hypothetical protein [Treponema sp.]